MKYLPVVGTVQGRKDSPPTMCNNGSSGVGRLGGGGRGMRAGLTPDLLLGLGRLGSWPWIHPAVSLTLVSGTSSQSLEVRESIWWERNQYEVKAELSQAGRNGHPNSHSIAMGSRYLKCPHLYNGDNSTYLTKLTYTLKISRWVKNLGTQ